MRNVTIGGIVNFTINVTIEGFIDKKSAECRFGWLRKNGQVIEVCTIHINYPVHFLLLIDCYLKINFVFSVDQIS